MSIKKSFKLTSPFMKWVAIIGGIVGVLSIVSIFADSMNLLDRLRPTKTPTPNRSDTPQIDATQPAILVKIQVTNSGLSEVAIYTQGNFFLTKQLDDGSIQVMKGEYKLTMDDAEGSQGESILTEPAKTVSIKAIIPSSYLRLLEKGEYDLYLSFRRIDNTSFVTQTIPFTEEALNKYYLLIDPSK
jgi:hypothetical protein